MSKKKIREDSNKIVDRKAKIIIVRRMLVIMLACLLIIYFVLRIVYETGKFTITLDSAGDPMSAIVMYESKTEQRSRQILEATSIDFITNISVDWIPKNINDEADGSHNGDNYIAYTFYLENKSDRTINYWYEVILDDIINNVDEALRVMIFLNGEKTIYGKLNSRTKEPEKDTVAFFSDEKVAVEGRKRFASGEIDKITVVVWIEGDDPDCIDDLIGGEVKMHMKITEEQITQE